MDRNTYSTPYYDRTVHEGANKEILKDSRLHNVNCFLDCCRGEPKRHAMEVRWDRITEEEADRLDKQKPDIKAGVPIVHLHQNRVHLLKGGTRVASVVHRAVDPKDIKKCIDYLLFVFNLGLDVSTTESSRYPAESLMLGLR